MRALTLLLCLCLLGCDAAAPEPEPTPAPAAVDAGTEAFVRRAIPLLWGRAPRGIAEVELLAERAEASDRASLVRAMATSDEYVERWQELIYDHLRVNRSDFRANPDCYARRGPGSGSGDLAAWIRDHGPEEAAPPTLEHWTMRDLVDSALRLDDVSVIWRAQVFAQLAKDFLPFDAANAREVQRNLAEIFERQALGRNLDCAPCHNSDWSITGSDDPSQDRTWEIPGRFEAALFGASDGMDRDRLSAMFRRRGVLDGYVYPIEAFADLPPDGCQPRQEPGCDGCACEATVCAAHPSCCSGGWGPECTSACADSADGCHPGAPPGWEGCEPFPNFAGCDGCACEAAVCGQLGNCCELSWDASCATLCAELGGDCPIDTTPPSGHRPWGAGTPCGLFLLPGEIEDDPLARDAYFVSDHGLRGSAWDLEALLAEGTERLRDGFDRDEELDVDGAEAFAYLTVLALADAAWEEAFGARLTLAHHFPRNRAQRDQLVALGDAALSGGFSLVEILVAITGHPAFNALAAEAGAPFPALFDPFAPDRDGDPGNGPGELVRHRSPRDALSAAADAMAWVPPPDFVSAADGSWYEEEERLGFFLKDSVHGFSGGSMQWAAAWEAAVGSCASRAPGNDGCSARGAPGCAGCSCEASVCSEQPWCCAESWDEACAVACQEGPVCAPAPGVPMTSPDRVDELLLAAPAASLADALSTLKDALLADPVIEGWERDVLAELLRAPLDGPADEAALRLACGLWLSSPQFLLDGDPLVDRRGAAPPIALPGRDRAALDAALDAAMHP